MKITKTIDFNQISKDTGVDKGKIYYSAMFESWVVRGHENIDLICIKPPNNVGDVINGKKVKSVKILNNKWVFKLEKGTK